MASHHEELLATAEHLLRREAGQRGPLPAARVRRRISTSYYALFHFVLDEVARKIVGSGHRLARRRRLFSRTISHRSVRIALDKVRGAHVDTGVGDFFHVAGDVGVRVRSPSFLRDLANLFLEAQGLRQEADYDLGRSFSEADAWLLRSDVRDVIKAWRAATTAVDRDFKRSLSLMIVLRGQTRLES